MPDLRPSVPTEQVHTFLSQHFHAPILELAPVEGGQVARTLSFRVGNEEYIVRFNLDKMLQSNFPKEAYLIQKLAATGLPLAPIVHVGRMGDLYVAISRKLPGKMLQEHTPAEVEALLPQMLEILETVHSIDTSDTSGYGVFNDQGQGYATSWHAHLLAVADEESEDDYYGKWHRMFDETMLERGVFERLFQRMKELLVYCPEERTLLLGGLSTRNLLAQDGKITGMLDLLDAQYGDSVYDIIAMDFWWPPLGLREAFLTYQLERGRSIPFYEERVLCYECRHALDGLRFFAKADNKEAYQMTCGIIQDKLAAYDSRT